MLQRFPVIVGATAGGKTALAIELARAVSRAHGIDAEIISADSMQVYRGMDIGSAKPSAEELAAVVHHLIGVAEPGESFTVDRWLALTEEAIAGIRSRGHLPIVVGGTLLYIKALLEGLFDGPEADEALREALRAMGTDALRAELERVDPSAAERIHPNDTRRTVRALEVFRLTGTAISELQAQWDRGGSREDALLVGLGWEPDAINRRINARVKLMLEQGLVEETTRLWETGKLVGQAREGLGYKQLIEHLEGGCSLDDAVERIKVETRRFAKNQRTWLRRLRTTPGSLWFEVGEMAPDKIAQAVIDKLFT